jgi:flagellum-specific ATP synthase
MPGCNSEAENALVGRARTLIARYEDMAEMIRLGAYQAGSDHDTDEAIRYHAALEAFLGQRQDEHTDLASGYRMLNDILGSNAS